ncbi:hypothetical protein BD626DRAFT_497796 [Schizophyllum amplum]|uniref:Secreted protein n=1 Tax=Schizophyllum amplum TaxID=97359 RepID=A0A550CCM8_9AGAR|nr:hypothetical protein BD626DRAFT_497796 [Auriculariopsis ampla]
MSVHHTSCSPVLAALAAVYFELEVGAATCEGVPHSQAHQRRELATNPGPFPAPFFPSLVMRFPHMIFTCLNVRLSFDLLVHVEDGGRRR